MASWGVLTAPAPALWGLHQGQASQTYPGDHPKSQAKHTQSYLCPYSSQELHCRRPIAVTPDVELSHLQKNITFFFIRDPLIRRLRLSGLIMTTERNSFYPAAKKVFSNKIVKWLLGTLMTALIAAVTTGIWPFFQGWVATRASTEVVEKIDKRVVKIEDSHEVNYQRLNSALSDDTGALTQGEQVQWLILRVKRLQERVVISIRARVALEARLRMPRPNSEAAKRVAGNVVIKYDGFIRQGDSPDKAAQKALESTFGKD